MTPADIVAEALRRAGDKTPHFMAGGEDGVVNEKYLGVVDTEIVFDASELDSEANYLRRDVVDAALAHVAERCARAEERATRLSAALDQVVEMTQGDVDLFDRAYGVAHDAQRACGACFGKKDKVAAHG